MNEPPNHIRLYSDFFATTSTALEGCFMTWRFRGVTTASYSYVWAVFDVSAVRMGWIRQHVQSTAPKYRPIYSDAPNFSGKHLPRNSTGCMYPTKVSVPNQRVRRGAWICLFLANVLLWKLTRRHHVALVCDFLAALCWNCLNWCTVVQHE